MHKNIIFIGGSAHSGTSLLEYLLNFHSNIHSICNYNNLSKHIEFIENDIDIFKSINDFNKYINNLINKLNLKENDFLLLKNPDNIYYIDKINEFTNNKAHIILLIRNAKDTSLSLIKRNDSAWPDYKSALLYWIKINNLINECNYKNVYKLNYEDLTNNTLLKLKEIYLFLLLNDESNDNYKQYLSLCNKTINDFPDDKEHVKLRQTQLLTPIYNSSRHQLTKEQEDIYNELIT